MLTSRLQSRQGRGIRAAPKRSDVSFSCDSRMQLIFHCELFRGQPEGIPSCRMQDIEALHAFHTHHDIRCGIMDMPHVQTFAGWISEHVHHIVFRAYRGRVWTRNVSWLLQYSCHFCSISEKGYGNSKKYELCGSEGSKYRRIRIFVAMRTPRIVWGFATLLFLCPRLLFAQGMERG